MKAFKQLKDSKTLKLQDYKTTQYSKHTYQEQEAIFMISIDAMEQCLHKFKQFKQFKIFKHFMKMIK